MAADGRYKRLLIWAAFGGVLSLFLAHPPPEHINPVDRLADRAVAICVWALIGAIASIVYTFFRSTPTTAIPEAPEQPLPEPRVTAAAQTIPTEEEMIGLGVTRDGERFRYRTHLYDKLDDALNYARLDRSRPYRCK
jgi:hypothetical protein